MAIKTKDELFEMIHTRIGDDSSDEAISFLEDVTDTYNDLEQRANGNGEDWKKKYEENDKAWKERYKHRFYGGDGGIYIPDTADKRGGSEYDPESVTMADLFSKKGE